MAARMIDGDFASMDVGNGWAGGYRVVRGKVKSFGIPHARARVTGELLHGDLGGQNIVEYADFCGQRYGYGDGIWNLTDSPIDLHQNTARRYGENMHIFLTLVVLAELGFKSGSELTMVVPVPPGLYNQLKPTVQKAFEAGDGSAPRTWHIQLRNDKKPREYVFKRIIVIPEGAGAYACYLLNANGEKADMSSDRGNLLSGRVAVVDLGMGTGDTYTLFDGNFNPDAISHATNDQAGILSHILTPLMNEIGDMFKSASLPPPTHLSTAHLDSYLRRYLLAESDSERREAATPRISGYNVDIEAAILYNVEQYAQWIASNLLDPLFSKGVDGVVAAGGGWAYCLPFISKWYPDRLIMTPDMFPHTKMVSLHDLNGIGQLRFLQHELAKQQV